MRPISRDVSTLPLECLGFLPRALICKYGLNREMTATSHPVSTAPRELGIGHSADADGRSVFRFVAAFRTLMSRSRFRE